MEEQIKQLNQKIEDIRYIIENINKEIENGELIPDEFQRLQFEAYAKLGRELLEKKKELEAK